MLEMKLGREDTHLKKAKSPQGVQARDVRRKQRRNHAHCKWGELGERSLRRWNLI